MEATHILLGRPWQYDRHVLHDGLANTMSFSFQGCKVTLKPLSPQEVHEDQIKMKTKRENEKAKEVSAKPSHNTLSIKSIMLTRVIPQLESTRYSSSLSFSLSKVPTSTPSWLKNVFYDFYIPPNGFHQLRRLFFKTMSSFPNNLFQHGLSIEPLFLNSQRLQMLNQVCLSLLAFSYLISN